MKISYNWLGEYLTEIPEPEKLSSILTAVGLEVESLERFEEIKGSLGGLITGEVIECIKHPDADKLKVTKVDTGNDKTLQIVCGAPNVAVGQRVIVATAGTTLYPLKGDSFTIKNTKIRGQDSQGMICAEDEIGIGENHEGIIVLPDEVKVGSKASDYFTPYSDWIFEIGITPNRMDAMSHLGVARDVYAYLSLHYNKSAQLKSPFKNSFKVDNQNLKIEVVIENTKACRRYSGISISNIKVSESPKWLQQKLKSIGVRPINNIVDITNYILHETGQPLHAFDTDEIKDNLPAAQAGKVIVKNLPEGTPFITLDGKERELNAEDLMICSGEEEPLCIGGVFGGIKSGVKDTTKNIFLESAWFHPKYIRRTSLRHNVRTDASTRFEKGVDISNTVNVLKRAAKMIKEIAGGEIASDVVDVYPDPKPKTEVVLKNHYLKKISGKNYHHDTVNNILQSLEFEILKENPDDIRVAVPFSKSDIALPADIIEEIMRIDGYDNIEIPSAITISPAIETAGFEAAHKERAANYLIGSGFTEILTNSITNSAYYKEEVLNNSIKLLNNISAELNIMRPSLLETGLECIAYNINHRNNNLLLFEFGKTYSTAAIDEYKEEEHLCLYASGNKNVSGWRNKETKTDIYYIKGICQKLFQLSGINDVDFKVSAASLNAFINDELIAQINTVAKNKLEQFSVKEPVFFADINWEKLTALVKRVKIAFTEISKYPEVHRDISMILNKNISYENVEKLTKGLNIPILVNIKLFDIFESEKLGQDKRSLAISFTFSDKEKTLTDKEIDVMMNKIIISYEKELGAQIRKAS